MTTTNEHNSARPRLMMRLGRNRLDLVSLDPANNERPIDYQPYSVNAGISMAANLREALRTCEILQYSYQRVIAMVDAQVLMVPVDLYNEAQKETLYHSPLTTHHSDYPRYRNTRSELRGALPYQPRLETGH